MTPAPMAPGLLGGGFGGAILALIDADGAAGLVAAVDRGLQGAHRPPGASRCPLRPLRGNARWCGRDPDRRDRRQREGRPRRRRGPRRATATTSSASTSSAPRPRLRAAAVADLTELRAGRRGVALSAMRVVHLAAIPAPGLQPDELTFRINTASTYNVFSQRRRSRLGRVVWASSETVLGLPFEREPPAFAPIDEDHPARPEFTTRCRSWSPRSSRGSSTAGPVRLSSACGSRTSWSRTTTPGSRASGTTHSFGAMEPLGLRRRA